MNIITTIDESITVIEEQEASIFYKVRKRLSNFLTRLGNAGNCLASCNKAFCNLLPESWCVETGHNFSYRRRCHREEVNLRVVEEPQDDLFWRWHARELGLSFDDVTDEPCQGATNQTFQEIDLTNNGQEAESSESESTSGQSCMKLVTVVVEVHAEMDSHHSQVTKF